ncbi:hypothetical protein OJAV_G00135650 [Oryzias javanicus]|uniref:Uncharacterized protein n=1 Tax=Oryzias javanicus TaxID=123683 RepID=A0A3S2LXK5_ORYJA|nr:hypothetical protein OJAV_G00135650 [Oryzias javanicus]
MRVSVSTVSFLFLYFSFPHYEKLHVGLRFENKNYFLVYVDMQRMQFGVIQQWDNIDARRERVPKSLIYLNEDPTLSSRNILPLPLKMTSWKALQPRSAVSEETGFKSQRMVALLLKEFKSGPTSGVSWIHIDLRTGSQFSRGSQVHF